MPVTEKSRLTHRLSNLIISEYQSNSKKLTTNISPSSLSNKNQIDTSHIKTYDQNGRSLSKFAEDLVINE